ncbi:MAG: hypothetical protein OES26_23325, partial [Gammaproteobacteria bacterium]|nr:hypothetical protein [Gammaproteobacteria bacterium]
MTRRVVVTGVGVITALGTNIEEFWLRCLSGDSCVSAIPAHWRDYSDYQSDIWSPLPEIDFAEQGFTRME